MQKTFSRLARNVAGGAVVVVLLGSAGRETVAQKTELPRRTEVVRTAEGPVRGIIRAGVRQFLGIRYAAAPVGNLRWRPPVAPANWDSTLDAVAFGKRCAQNVTLGVFAAPSDEEDCLFLNVFAPLHAGTAARLPSDGLDPRPRQL